MPLDGVSHGPEPSVLGANADRYRVEVDAQHGLVISVHAFFAERVYQTIDVLDLQLDGPLSAEVFDFHEPVDVDGKPAET